MAIPPALRAVAIVFLLEGIVALIVMFAYLVPKGIQFDLHICGIFTFFGLRAFARGWRAFALVLVWLDLIAFGLACIVDAFGPVPDGEAYLYGYFPITQRGLIAFSLFIIALALWKLRVLTRPDIRALFYAPTSRF